jgi:hypothetical protein
MAQPIYDIPGLLKYILSEMNRQNSYCLFKLFLLFNFKTKRHIKTKYVY